MKAPVIALFNSRRESGKTFLAYHLAWIYADLGYSVVAADFDPQADLSAAMLGCDRFEDLLLDERQNTISSSLRALTAGQEGILVPPLDRAREGLESIALPASLQDVEAPTVIAGDPDLADSEEELSEAWRCGAFEDSTTRVLTAFRKIVQKAADIRKAQIVLIDLGSNLGAVNRAALIAADFVVVPVAGDPLSLRHLRSTGSTLRRWRQERGEGGAMQPIGYVVQRPPLRLDRPGNPERWLAEIPAMYRRAVLGEPGAATTGIDEDPHCLGLLKSYPGLLSLAREAHKPIFHLKPADGAMGAHSEAVKAVERELTRLAQAIAERIGLHR